jgi:hypothetical protein
MIICRSCDGESGVQDYDWYGAYGNPEHGDHGYADSLRLDYTFDHPQIQDNVSQLLDSCKFLLSGNTVYKISGDMCLRA